MQQHKDLWPGLCGANLLNQSINQSIINLSIIYLNQAARPMKTKQTHRQKNKTDTQNKKDEIGRAHV